MTFVFHHYSGTVLGIVLARLLGLNEWALGAFGFIAGGWSDTASWVLYKLSQFSWWKWKKWDRWEYYTWCHPPLEEWGHGKHDKWGKWIPMWGQHTWLWDSIVHGPRSPKFLFPQFPIKWKDEVWIEIWPSHWNIQFSKWDVLYVVLELSLWGLYTALLFI